MINNKLKSAAHLNESGSALLSVLLIGIIGMIIVAMVMRSTQVSIKKAGVRRSNVVLLNIAEAGNQDAISKIKSNQISFTPGAVFTIASNYNFGGGSYTVRCSTGSAIDSIQLTSTATYKGQSKSIQMLCVVSSCMMSGDAFNYAIIAGGDITWKGSGNLTVNSSAVYCNGSFSISGSSDITSNVYARNQIAMNGSSNIFGNVWTSLTKETGSGSIHGTVTKQTNPIISIPMIDITPYLKQALDSGQVYNSDQHLTGSTNTVVPGGVMYVNGNFKRSSSGNFKGCIIATGDITLSGSGNYEKFGNLPMAVSINGKIDIAGSGDVHGLLLAQNGDFEVSGSGNITGSIICSKNLSKTGSWNYMNYEKSVPVPPGCAGNSFTILSWKEL